MNKKTAGLRSGRRVVLRSLGLCAGVFSLSAAAALAQPAPNARPQGGTVVAGQASISFGPGVVNINSTTPQVVIDWQSFSIGARQQVVITGPKNATVLNRVTGPEPSEIAGSLNSGGDVYLINASGVTYYQAAVVDVAGLVSTSINITNQNFINSQFVFDTPGTASAIVENRGEISISEGGFLAFVAASAANSGTIRAPRGSVALGSASTFGLNPTSTFPLGSTGLGALTGTTQSDLVVNAGTIRARGGDVALLANVAPNVGGSIRAGGIIRTRTDNGQTGTIILSATGAGVVVEGALDASGAQAGTTGGAVQVVGSSTELAATSVVDVSGQAGGGTVALGTTLARAKGGPGTASTATSNTVSVDQGAQVSADALAAGNGGRVAVLSNAQTSMAGAITARGGDPSGDGGFVEVSSAGVLSLTGTVDVGALFGSVGTLLLDPYNFTITAPIANALSAQLLAGRGGKLIIQADHDIEVDAPIDGRGGVPGTQLIINAGNQIKLNAPVLNNAPIAIDVGAGGVLASPGATLCAGDFSVTVKSEDSSISRQRYAGGTAALSANCGAGESRR